MNEKAAVRDAFSDDATAISEIYNAAIAEASVYVAPQARGRGLGTLLAEALASAAEERGFHKVIGKLLTDNAASIRLTERCGFDSVGLHRRHGQLDDLRPERDGRSWSAFAPVPRTERDEGERFDQLVASLGGAVVAKAGQSGEDRAHERAGRSIAPLIVSEHGDGLLAVNWANIGGEAKLCDSDLGSSSGQDVQSPVRLRPEA